MIPGKQYSPEVLLRVAWRRKWLIVLPALALAIVSVLAIEHLPNRYRSDILILVVPQQVPESYVRSTVTTSIEDRLQSIGQQILSRTMLERIIKEFNLYPERRKTEIMEDIVERMRTKDISIDIVKGDAFRVSFTADDPRTAMKVTERLGSLFIDESLRDREVLAEGTNQFIEAQLNDARRRLIENERKVEEYRRRHDGELPSQLESNQQGLHNTEMQLQALVESINRDRDRRLVVERSLADANAVDAAMPPDARAAGATSPAEQLRVARAALAAMELRLTPNHPDVIRAKRTVAELQKRADDAAKAKPAGEPVDPVEAMRRNRVEESKAELAKIDRQLADKQTEESRLRQNIAAYQARIEAAPTREAELADLTRDYDTLQQSYRNLLAKKEDSQIAASLERRQIGERFKIIDQARLPERPSSPNRPRLYGIAIVGSLAISLALVAVVEYFDRAMRNEQDVRAALNLIVLATVPVMGRPSKKRRWARVAASLTFGMAAIGVVVAVWRLWR